MGGTRLVRYAAAVAALFATPATAATIYLSCDGTAGGERLATTTGVVGNTAGLAVTDERVEFEDSVRVRIEESGGAVTIPRKMLPLSHSGGKSGWYELRELNVGPDEITGRVRLNMYNKPRVRLDRVTGRITIQGPTGDFTGTCMPYDPASTERKF